MTSTKTLTSTVITIRPLLTQSYTFRKDISIANDNWGVFQ